jgi:hypothetical protein
MAGSDDDNYPEPEHEKHRSVRGAKKKAAKKTAPKKKPAAKKKK